MGKMDFEVELKEARQELEKSNAFCFPNRILNFLAADFSDRAIKQRRPAIFYRCSTESQDRWPGPLAPNKKQIAKCTQDFFPSRFFSLIFLRRTGKNSPCRSVLLCAYMHNWCSFHFSHDLVTRNMPPIRACPRFPFFLGTRKKSMSGQKIERKIRGWVQNVCFSFKIRARL